MIGTVWKCLSIQWRVCLLFRGNNKCEPEAQIQWDEARELLLTTSDHFLCPHDISMAQDRHVRPEQSPSREAAKLVNVEVHFRLPTSNDKESTTSQLISLPISVNTILPISKRTLSFSYPTTICMNFSSLHLVPHARLSHPVWSDHPNYAQWGPHTMSLLAMLFSPLILSLFCSIILLNLLSYYNPEFMSENDRASIAPTQTSGVFFYFNLYVFGLNLPEEVTILLWEKQMLFVRTLHAISHADRNCKMIISNSADNFG